MCAFLYQFLCSCCLYITAIGMFPAYLECVVQGHKWKTFCLQQHVRLGFLLIFVMNISMIRIMLKSMLFDLSRHCHGSYAVFASVDWCLVLCYSTKTYLSCMMPLEHWLTLLDITLTNRWVLCLLLTVVTCAAWWDLPDRSVVFGIVVIRKWILSYQPSWLQIIFHLCCCDLWQL